MAKGTVNYTPRGPSKRDIDFDVYKERDLEKTEVNWADVAKNITQEIETIRDDRQKRKDEIQKATDETMTKLDETGQYDNKTLMDLVIDGSNYAANSMLTQKKLMERGLVRPQDYTKFTSNVSAGFKTLKKTAEGWDKDFAEYTKRTEDGTNSSLEIYLAKEVESFGNINDMQLYTNPETGNMALASTYTDDDGITRMNEDPNTHISMQRLNALSKQRIDKVKVGEVSKVYGAELGAYVKAIYDKSDKSVTTIEDITARPDFQQLLEDKANQALSSSSTAGGSILADNNLMTEAGEKYRAGTQEEFDEFASANPDEANPFIVMDYDQKTQRKIPKLTKEQEEVAKNYMKAQIKGHIEYKQKVQPGKFPPQPTTASYGIEKDKKIQIGYMENVNKLMSGDAQTFKTVVKDIVGDLNKDKERGDELITDIDRTPDEFVITFTQGGRTRTERIPRLDANKQPVDLNDVAQGLFQYVTPEKTSFDESLKIYNTPFTQRDDENYAGDVSAKGGRGFTTKREVVFTNTFIDPTGETTIQAAFDAIPSGRNNFKKAASVTKQALDASLRGVTTDIQVNWIDRSGGENDIVITVDGNKYIIPFDDDNTKLAARVQNIINKQIKVHNAKGAEDAAP